MEEAVPELPTGQFELDAIEAGSIIIKNRNWSAPGPDSIANYCLLVSRPLLRKMIMSSLYGLEAAKRV